MTKTTKHITTKVGYDERLIDNLLGEPHEDSLGAWVEQTLKDMAELTVALVVAVGIPLLMYIFLA